MKETPLQHALFVAGQSFRRIETICFMLEFGFNVIRLV